MWATGECTWTSSRRPTRYRDTSRDRLGVDLGSVISPPSEAPAETLGGDAFGSCVRVENRVWSHTLSGWPAVTDRPCTRKDDGKRRMKNSRRQSRKTRYLSRSGRSSHTRKMCPRGGLRAGHRAVPVPLRGGIPALLIGALFSCTFILIRPFFSIDQRTLGCAWALKRAARSRSGYAGTGKTTVIAALAARARRITRAFCSTGKASQVLRQTLVVSLLPQDRAAPSTRCSILLSWTMTRHYGSVRRNRGRSSSSTGLDSDRSNLVRPASTGIPIIAVDHGQPGGRIVQR